MKTLTLTLLALCFATCSVNAHSDETIIAATLILEAGGEYAEGAMESVYEVICTRAWKRKLSRSEVCLQRLQFSCWNSGKIDLLVIKAQRHIRYAEALEIVNSSKITNYTADADHYHADYCSPYWASSLTRTVKIGRHIFYK
jgi:spore germination cell wall hydrolase CwlJ-like protein